MNESTENLIPPSSSSSLLPTRNEDRLNLRVYRTTALRWVMVLVLALLNSTSAYLWISFAPVANHFGAYYSASETTLNFIQMIFPLTTVIFGLPASLVIDYLGTRLVLCFSALANLICGILRVVSSASFLRFLSPHFRLILVGCGQCVASFAQPLCMFIPTKLALEWFPDRQRTVANTIGSLANALGVLFGSALAPVLVKTPNDLPRFNYFSLAIVSIGTVLTLSLVRRSKPQNPPSAAAELASFARCRQSVLPESGRILDHRRRFQKQLCEPFRLAGFWILIFSFGSMLAYYTMVSTLFQQMLCTKGYSNQFSGICAVVMIGAGLIASVFTAVYVDRTGLFIESIKFCYMMALLGVIGFGSALWYSQQPSLILVSVIWFGTFSFSQYSVALELAAEATFPLPESVSSAILIVGSQVLSIFFVGFVQALAPFAEPSTQFKQTCGPDATPQDYCWPHFGVCILMTLIGIVQLKYLRLPYKRRTSKVEQGNAGPGPLFKSNEESVEQEMQQTDSER
ncbi:unnamed protein product [Calicophoron daubneyi]|uniref:Major facilitator superfamily (MFS) profile domain-containing protein n=1 Tax=Calicophoron daubneyi TaxID=300641 RepID=A0AAV2TS05_CALDB